MLWLTLIRFSGNVRTQKPVGDNENFITDHTRRYDRLFLHPSQPRHRQGEQR